MMLITHTPEGTITAMTGSITGGNRISRTVSTIRGTANLDAFGTAGLS